MDDYLIVHQMEDGYVKMVLIALVVHVAQLLQGLRHQHIPQLIQLQAIQLRHTLPQLIQQLPTSKHGIDNAKINMELILNLHDLSIAYVKNDMYGQVMVSLV